MSISIRTRTCSTGSPSRRAATRRATVAWPCPCGTEPSSTVTTPCTSTEARTISVDPDLSRPGLRSELGVASPT